MLVHFDSRFPTRFSDVEETAQIGSMRSYYPEFSDYMIRSFISGTSKPENILGAITAIVQSYGIHSILSEMNVGGAFFGLYLDASGPHWQDDTTYVVYHDDDHTLDVGGVITVGIRDDVLFVGSSMINQTKFISSHLTAATMSGWMASWAESIFNILNEYRSEYYIFLSNKHWMATVVRTYGNLANEYFQVHPFDHNKVAFAFRNKFYEMICDIHAQPVDNELPFRFCWLHATNA
ncbi:MAG: hypothetical protein V1799_15325 [bacterium]